jgi:hypothetical protein
VQREYALAALHSVASALRDLLVYQKVVRDRGLLIQDEACVPGS